MSNVSGSPQAYLTAMKFRDNVVLLSDTPNGLRTLSDWNTVLKNKTFRRWKFTQWYLLDFTFITFPKRVEHRVWSRVSSFNFEYLFFSLRSHSGCSSRLPCLLVPYTLPPIRCFRQQFLRCDQPSKRSFLFYVGYSYLLSLVRSQLVSLDFSLT